MRISTTQLFNANVNNYQKGYADLIKSYQQISSGERIQTASDDPLGASRLLQLEQQQGLLKQYSDNLSAATTRLETQSSTVSSIINVLHRAQESVLSAGSGMYQDTDRQAQAATLKQLEDELLSLMNTRDSNGQYLFSGARSNEPPFVRNADGTYSYQGEQSQMSLQVSSSLSLAVSDNGWDAFENIPSSSRTQSSLTQDPNSDGQRVYLSQGMVSNADRYNSEFRAGAPYSVEVTSGSTFVIRDNNGVDVTAEMSSQGSFEASAAGGTSGTFRGVDLRLTVGLQQGDDADTSEELDSLLTGYTFELGVAPEQFSINRMSGNGSSAQLLSATVTDQGLYDAGFPGAGVVVKFTSDTDYEVYARPLSSASTPLGQGSLNGTPPTLEFAGASIEVSGTPQDGDQFVIDGRSQETGSILNTLVRVRQALEAPVGSDLSAQLKLQEELAYAIDNLSVGMDQVLSLESSVGVRLNTVAVLKTENESLTINNASAQSTIRDTDMAAAISDLMLQQSMLQAAQAAFARIGQLSLFDRL